MRICLSMSSSPNISTHSCGGRHGEADEQSYFSGALPETCNTWSEPSLNNIMLSKKGPSLFPKPEKAARACFQHGMSFRKRFTYATSSWKEIDQQTLQKSAKKLEYWKIRLGGLFPGSMQHSLLVRAIPTKMLGGNT